MFHLFADRMAVIVKILAEIADDGSIACFD